jgi:hypothetical protein
MRSSGLVVVAVLASIACGSRHREPPPPPPAPGSGTATAPPVDTATLLTDAQISTLIANHRQDAWYSLYMADRHAGWAHVEMRPSTATEPAGYTVAAHARIELASPDGPRFVEMTETSSYATTAPFALIEKRQTETSDSGATERVYRARPDHLELISTDDGEAAPPRRLPATAETLVSQILSSATPPTVRAGQRTTYAQFDDEDEADQQVTATVISVGDEVIAGVKVPVVTVETLDEGDSVPTRIRTADGVALAVTLGPGLRLELADRARAQSTIEQLSMMDTSVAIDRRLGDLGDRDTLTLVIGGIDGVVLPTSPTQTDEVLPDRRRRVTVRRGPGAVVTPAERAQGLAPTAQYDAKHPAIVALAKQIVDGAADDRERTERIVMWVYDNLRKDLSTSLATASQVLDRKHGDCTEHTLLVVALLRAAGIPARDVGGLMYEDTTGRFYWHAWAQAAIEDRWVAVDGAWGQPVADVGHLAFDVNGRGNGGSAMGSITITAEP